jgi:hypothetical protein
MEAVRSITCPGDILIATGYTFAVSEYYVKRWNLPVTLYSYPLSLKSHPGFFNPADEGSRPEVLAHDAHFLAQQASSPAIKLVVLLTPYEINDPLERALADNFQLRDAAGQKIFSEAILRTPVRLLAGSNKATSRVRP